MYIQCTPGAHPLTIFVCALTPLFRTALTKSQSIPVHVLGYSAQEDHQACQHGLSTLPVASSDDADKAREVQLAHLIAKVFGVRPGQPPRADSNETRSTLQTTISGSSGLDGQFGLPGDHRWNFHEQRLEHITAQDDMRNLVHEAFSPNADPWAGWEAFEGDVPKGY